jgi:virulence-associated protein VagC
MSATASPFSTDSKPKPAVKTAKLFMNGRSQAVRLPKEFRFEGNEVAIRRDETTGDVTLTPFSAPAPPRRDLLELLGLFDAQHLSESEFENEISKMGKLTAEELVQLLDWAEFPEGYFQREVHRPRELDLF